MYICTYIPGPSCYVTTSCIGEPINGSITYSDCCMNFGVSYDLDGRCQPCPSTSKCTASVLHKLLFACTYIIMLYLHMYLVYTQQKITNAKTHMAAHEMIWNCQLVYA